MSDFYEDQHDAMRAEVEAKEASEFARSILATLLVSYAELDPLRKQARRWHRRSKVLAFKGDSLAPHIRCAATALDDTVATLKIALDQRIGKDQ